MFRYAVLIYSLLHHGVLSPVFVQLAEAAEELGVDWSSDAITAVGIGDPPANPANVAQARAMAIRSAILNAQENLGSIVRRVPVTAESTVEQILARDNLVRIKIETLLKGAHQIGKPNYLPDGSIEVRVGIPLSALADAVLPDTGFAPEPLRPGPIGSGPNVFTGVVIDARGLGVLPALAPRVLDEKGNELYGPSFVSRKQAVNGGMAGYMKSLEDAWKDGRAGKNPLLVKGVGAAGQSRPEVNLSAEDAVRLREAVQAYDFLSQGSVLFLID